MTTDDKRSMALSAYHDGELSRFARRRVERQLRKSAALRRELAELENLSGAVREIESAPASLVTPDLWPEIGPALSTIDRELNRGIGYDPGSNREGAVSRTPIGMTWGWLAAGGALAVLVLALAVDNQGAIPEHSTPGALREIAGGSLRYLQTNGVSYVVSQDSEDVTIIWLMDAVAAAEGA